VVIAIIAILAAMLLPALARAKDKAQALRCMSNNKQLILGAHLYGADSQECLPPNGDEDGDGIYWFGGNLQDSTDSGCWDPTYPKGPNNKLAPYTSGDVGLYKCPGDKTTVVNGTTLYPRIRSYSMSRACGTTGGADGVPNGIASVGLWLDQDPTYQDGQQVNPLYQTYGKVSDTSPPGPVNVWVFVDEDESSIGIGAFAVSMTKTGWTSWPGTRHGFSASFSFLDGHAEIHKWRDGSTKNATKQKGPLGKTGSFQRINLPGGSADLRWLQDHTSSLK
jgi:prepilin-type processing-associated H-X9-DG protein